MQARFVDGIGCMILINFFLNGTVVCVFCLFFLFKNAPQKLIASLPLPNGSLLPPSEFITLGAGPTTQCGLYI